MERENKIGVFLKDRKNEDIPLHDRALAKVVLKIRRVIKA